MGLKAQERGNAGVDILCEVRRPTRQLCSIRGPIRHTTHQGHQEYTGETDLSITKNLSGGSPL